MDPLNIGEAKGGGGAARPAQPAERSERRSREPQEASEPRAPREPAAIGSAERDGGEAGFGRAVVFSIDRDTQEVIVKIVDRESGEVVREVPPEELRDALKALEEANQNLLDRLA